MKKTCLSFLCLLLAATTFCQNGSLNSKTREYYMLKSKHQKTTAWILLGGGVVLTGLGLATAEAEFLGNPVNASENGGGVGGVIVSIGILSTIGSIPFFISAARNKHKAAALAFQMQKIPSLAGPGYLAANVQPAITFTLSLSNNKK